MSRNRKANEEHSYQNDAFALLLARFDRVDRDNKDILEKFAGHVNDDLKIADKVNKHSTYWSLLIWFGASFVLAVIAWFQGLFKS